MVGPSMAGQGVAYAVQVWHLDRKHILQSVTLDTDSVQFQQDAACSSEVPRSRGSWELRMPDAPRPACTRQSVPCAIICAQGHCLACVLGCNRVEAALPAACPADAAPCHNWTNRTCAPPAYPPRSHPPA